MSKRKAKILIASYVGAALVALSLFSAVCYNHLQVYRRQTQADASRAFEETVGAIEQMSRSLEKSLYATDGAMCGKVCSEVYADARAAMTALSGLPFSTTELEHIGSFIGRTEDYAYTLCRQAAEQGFTEEHRQNLSSLSDQANELAGQLVRLRGRLSDKAIQMDSRETRLVNILPEEPVWLSGELSAFEESFSGVEPMSYDGRYAAQDDTPGDPVDDGQAAVAAQLLGCGADELELTADYADGSRRSYSSGTKTVSVTASGIESLTDSRLVSEEIISEQDALAAAEDFLTGQGYEALTLTEKNVSGAVLWLSYAAQADDITGLDRTLRLAIALDDASVVAFDASSYSQDAADLNWILTEEEALALLPAGLTPSETARVTLASPGGNSVPCYAFTCPGAKERTVTIYINAETGKQQEIKIL